MTIESVQMQHLSATHTHTRSIVNVRYEKWKKVLRRKKNENDFCFVLMDGLLWSFSHFRWTREIERGRQKERDREWSGVCNKQQAIDDSTTQSTCDARANNIKHNTNGNYTLLFVKAHTHTLTHAHITLNYYLCYALLLLLSIAVVRCRSSVARRMQQNYGFGNCLFGEHQTNGVNVIVIAMQSLHVLSLLNVISGEQYDHDQTPFGSCSSGNDERIDPQRMFALIDDRIVTIWNQLAGWPQS